MFPIYKNGHFNFQIGSLSAISKHTNEQDICDCIEGSKTVVSVSSLTLNKQIPNLYRKVLFKKLRNSTAKLVGQIVSILDLILGYVADETDGFLSIDSTAGTYAVDQLELAIEKFNKLHGEISTWKVSDSMLAKNSDSVFIFVDGFIMEGKSAYCNNLVDSFNAQGVKNLFVQEQSDLWRVVFTNDGDCLLSMCNRVCGVFHYINLFQSLHEFSTDKHLSHFIMDRGLFSASVFNSILMDPYLKKLVLEFYGVNKIYTHELSGGDRLYPWPLYNHTVAKFSYSRDFETKAYKSAINLREQARLYYSLKDDVIKLFTGTISNLDDFFKSMADIYDDWVKNGDSQKLSPFFSTHLIDFSDFQEFAFFD